MLIAVSLSLLLSAFFSGTESGFYFVRKERLRVLEAQAVMPAKVLVAMMEHPRALVCTMLVGNNLALQLGTESTVRYISDGDWNHPWLTAEVLTTLFLFFPFFLFGEVLPKTTYRIYGLELLLKTVPLIQLSRWLFWPIAAFVGWLSKLLERQCGVEMDGAPVFDRDYMSKNIGLAHAGGVLSDEQLESLNQAMASGSQPVGRMMDSLIQSSMLSINSSIADVMKVYGRDPMVAYPVFERRKTHVVGWVDMGEVTRAGYGGDSLRPWLKDPVYVDWAMPFRDAMSLFFEGNVPILFVKKEGKVVGFIPWVDALHKMLR